MSDRYDEIAEEIAEGIPGGYAINLKNIAAILRQRFPNEWVSVKERLPKKNGVYEIYTDNGRVGTGNFMHGSFRNLYFKNPDFSCPNVAFWRIPAQPTEKGE